MNWARRHMQEVEREAYRILKAIDAERVRTDNEEHRQKLIAEFDRRYGMSTKQSNEVVKRMLNNP